MPGWFVDNVIGFLVSLVRIAARKWRARRYSGWHKATATVVGVNWEAQLWMPRPDAEIVYTYRIDGRLYGGVDTKPFCLESSAKAYAGQFSKGDTLVIRVKPGEPETSAVLDEDQSKVNQSAINSQVSQ